MIAVMKSIGAFLAVTSLIMMLASGVSTIVALFALCILSYNYLYGNSKGHPLHLILLGWTFAISVVGYMHHVNIIRDVNILILCIVICAVVTIIAFYKDVVSFYADYNSGVRKNYFYNPPKVESRF